MKAGRVYSVCRRRRTKVVFLKEKRPTERNDCETDSTMSLIFTGNIMAQRDRDVAYHRCN